MITVIGASCVDIICQNVSKDIFEKGHELADSIIMNYGGDGLNEAVLLAKMGEVVELITTVGDDELGKGICQYCRENDVNIVPSFKSSTYITTILVDSIGNRNLIGTRNGSLRELSLSDIGEIHGGIVSFASMFISNKLNRGDMVKLFTRIKDMNKTLCVDTTTIKNNETISDYKEVLNKIDYFFPNALEAKLFSRKETVIEAADTLFNAGIKNVIIKDGKKGAYLKNNDYSRYIETTSVDALDTTGCGDSFVSGFMHKLSKGEDIIECIKYANECGRKCAQFIGATSWLEN